MRGGLGDRAETAPGPASGLIQRSLLRASIPWALGIFRLLATGGSNGYLLIAGGVVLFQVSAFNEAALDRAIHAVTRTIAKVISTAEASMDSACGSTRSTSTETLPTGPTRAALWLRLGDLLRRQSGSRPSEAEAAYKKSLGIRETYWKDRDPAIPDILNALAEVSIAQENAEACRKYLNASLVVLGKLYGPGTAHRIKPLALQASLYEAQNDPGRALDSYQQCKTLADRLTPAEKSKYLMPELSEKIDHKCVELLAQLSQRPSEHSEESSKTTHSTSETPASK